MNIYKSSYWDKDEIKSMSKKCQNCQLEFGIFKYQYHCSDCKGAFCSACLDFALVTEEESKKGNSATASSFCEKCFIKNSNLDYSKNYEFYGTEIGKQPTILFVHGN